MVEVCFKQQINIWLYALKDKIRLILHLSYVFAIKRPIQGTSDTPVKDRGGEGVCESISPIQFATVQNKKKILKNKIIDNFEKGILI